MGGRFRAEGEGGREREREMGSVLLRQFVPMLAGSLLSVGRRKSPSSVYESMRERGGVAASGQASTGDFPFFNPIPACARRAASFLLPGVILLKVVASSSSY